MNSTQRIKSYYFFFAVSALAAVLMMLAYSPAHAAADQENCMLCHQYPLLGVVDDNGSLHSYYVSDKQFASSVHADIMCSECHRGITKIPHEKNTVIDCTVACHILEPTTGRPFTHKTTDDILKTTIHNVENSHVRQKVAADFPQCVDCHKNEKMSVNIDSRKGMDALLMAQGKARCEECHQNRYDYVDRKMIHVLRRTEKPKSQQEIVDMCSKCHNDSELNKRHGLVNAVYSYRENYHGKTMVLGLEEAPSCIDCHVLEGQSPHNMLSVSDNKSATHPENRGTMCQRADCHPTASKGMGRSYIHWEIDKSRYPGQYWVLFGFTILTVASFLGLMLIMIMEMFRMIFPKVTIFTIFKRRSK